jgi:lysophospholipase L1-like esterase
MPNHRGGKWLLLLLSLLVTGLIAEGIFRVVLEHQLAQFSVDLAPIVRQDPNPDILYSFMPQTTANAGQIQINSQGYRDDEFPSDEKRAGLFLILNLGDSVTFGGRVHHEETYAKRLEQRLSANPELPRVRVLNTGVPGYNSQQELAILRQLAPQVLPDLVLLGWVLNDADPAYNVYDQGPLLRNMYPLRGPSGITLRTLLYQSRLLIFLKDQGIEFQRHFPQLFPDAFFYLNRRVQRHEWQRMKEALLEMAKVAHGCGSKFMVVLFPYDVQLRRGTTPPQTDVAKFLQANGIPVLDVFPALAAHRDESLFVPDGIHLTAIGHQIVADEIYSALVAQGLTPSMPGAAHRHGDSSRGSCYRLRHGV